MSTVTTINTIPSDHGYDTVSSGGYSEFKAPPDVEIECSNDDTSVRSLPLDSILEGVSDDSFELHLPLPVTLQQDMENLQLTNIPPAGIDKNHIAKFVTKDLVDVKGFISALDKTGINVFKDIRFQSLVDALTTERSVTDSDQIPVLKSIPVDTFEQICRASASLINQALSGELILPDFTSFCAEIKQMYVECRGLTSGLPSQHIQQLARMSPDMWGVSICTVDGQRASFGHHSTPFSFQSFRDVLIYALAITECGEDEVHSHVGKEPIGGDDSLLTLDRDGLPHNAMIPSGALVVLSMIKPNYTLPDRFDYLFGIYERLAGFEGIEFSNANYLSEKMALAADNVHAIGYHLLGHKVIPTHSRCKLPQIIDLYLQLKSIEGSCDSAATIAATLANGGVCPFTAEAVYTPDAVRNTLSLLHSCGVRKMSGEKLRFIFLLFSCYGIIFSLTGLPSPGQWSFEVGLPAKSTISGGVMLVVPDVMGIVVWSPLLDKCGNSVRGVAFSKRLTEKYSFHSFDNLSPVPTNKMNPVRTSGHESKDVGTPNTSHSSQISKSFYPSRCSS